MGLLVLGPSVRLRAGEGCDPFSVVGNRADGIELPKTAKKEPGNKTGKAVKEPTPQEALPVGFGAEKSQEGQFLG